MTVTEEPTATTTSTSVIGQRLLRKEDPALLTGEARFTDDLQLPGALHLIVARSPYAHARITRIDTSAAAAAPGVVAVYTGADLTDLWAAPMPKGPISWSWTQRRADTPCGCSNCRRSCSSGRTR